MSKVIRLMINLTLTIFTVSVSATTEQVGKQENAPSVMLEPVLVTRSRDAVSLPYRKAFDAVKKVAENTDGLVAIYFQLSPAKEFIRIDDLRLWVEYDAEIVPITVSRDGFFSVPRLPAAFVDDAFLSANKQKGDLRLSVHLRPVATPETMTLEIARRTVEAAQRARAELIPWYFRLFTPRITALAACRADIGFSIQVNQPPVILQADRTERDEGGKTVHCVRLDNLVQASSDLAMVIPSDASLLLLSN